MLEKQVLRFLDGVRTRVPLPLKVVLWDGTATALSEHPTVTVRLNERAAARRFVKPSMSSLGEAFVEGELDVDGPGAREIVALSAEVRRLAP